MPVIVFVDPGELHVPPERSSGADLIKFTRRFSRFSTSIAGMPPLELLRGRNGALRVNDGVTRATRVARFCPGVLVPAEIIHDLPNVDVERWPKIKELLP